MGEEALRHSAVDRAPSGLASVSGVSVLHLAKVEAKHHVEDDAQHELLARHVELGRRILQAILDRFPAGLLVRLK